MNLLKLFGLKIGRDEDKEKNKEVTKKTFVAPDTAGATTIETRSGSGYYSFINTISLDENVGKTADWIKRYRYLALQPEVDSAIQEIVNEAITSSRTEELVEIDLSHVDGINENVKKVIINEFKNVLNLLNYKKKSYDYFKDFYIDGRIYFHKIVDEKDLKKGVVEVRQIDSLAISKVVEIEKEKDKKTGVDIIKKTKEMYLYTQTFLQSGGRNPVSKSIPISPDAIIFIHSGLYDANRHLIYGHLHKSLKTYNNLRMIEDASVIYRLTRSPERRAFYIDVGRMSRNQAEQHIRDVASRHRNNLKYNVETGELIDGKEQMTMLEDYFMPRFDGGRGTEIEVLQGGQNLGEIDDILYFQKKFYKSLNLPQTRIEPEAGFSLGRSAEITRDEVKFTKFIDRLLIRFSGIFDNLLGTNLILKGILKPEEWNRIRHNVYYDFLKDSYFQELKELEVWNERINVLNDMQEHVGKYFSKDWVRRNILRQNDKEIDDMKKQIETEKKEEPDDEENGGF